MSSNNQQHHPLRDEIDDENTIADIGGVEQHSSDNAIRLTQDDNEQENSPTAVNNDEQSAEQQEEQIEEKPITPLPKLAMIMISIIIIAEAVGYSILYPIVPFMVRDFLLFEHQQANHNGTIVNYNVSSSSLYSVGGVGVFNNFAILPTSFSYVNHQLSFNNLLNNSITINGTIINDDELEFPEERVGLLVGILASAYSVAQLISNWFISRSSDHLGRKPFLLSGLIVNVIFLGLFSFSKNFWFALVVRTIHGALNANVPIYKSFVVDVTDDTNQEKAFVIISILWAISNVVSPGLGGWLSKPAEKWPVIFGGKETTFYHFFNTNPYVLPLSIPIIMNIISIIFSAIFMKESLKNRFDIVNWILIKMGIRKKNVEEERELASSNSIEMMSSVGSNLDAFGTKDNLLSLEEVNESNSVDEDVTDQQQLTKEVVPAASKDEKAAANLSLLYLLKDSLVVKVALLYLFLGLATNIMDEMVPIFSSNSIQKRGLALDSSQIGLMLSIGGVTSLVMLIIYPKLSNKLGFLWLYRIGVVIYMFDVMVFPFSTELVQFDVNPWVVFAFATFCVFVKACAQEMAYTSQFLLVNNSAPSPEHIGSTCGLAHITASVGWAAGPFIGGVLLNIGLNWADSVSESNPNSWIAKVPLVDKISFWVCAGVCAFTFLLSLTVPKSILNRRYEKVEEGTKSV